MAVDGISTTVLSLDPGTAHTGWAIVNRIKRSGDPTINVLDYGQVQSGPKMKGIFAADEQVSQLEGLIRDTRLDLILFEMFSPRSPRKGMAGNMYLIGMIWEAIKRTVLPVPGLVYPSAWKSRFKDNEMIHAYYGGQLDGKIISQHEWDALGIAAYYFTKETL